MIIKTLTMVGNECEIIESFVRYNMNIVDEMIFIFDFGSVDKSMVILRNLMEEGFKIRIYDEPLVIYEQKALENKYLKLLVEEGDVDIIIPLDADEFIGCRTGNPRIELESLKLDTAYRVKWLNYVITENDDRSESFIPKRLVYCDPDANTYDKVIVPAKLVCDNRVSITTGHHGITGEVKNEMNNSLFIAHYPLISWEQYQSKIYCNSISYINWMNRADNEGIHLNKMLASLERGEKIGFDIYNSSETGNLQKLPLNLDFIENADEKLTIRYIEYAKVNLRYNLIKIAKNNALRLYSHEIKERFVNPNGVNVMIYGTGENAKKILNGIPENAINVICYIDSNREKQFTRFNKRIIIPPDFIRLFNYDRIIISSRKYYNEMMETLIANGVSKSYISGDEYLLDLLIESLPARGKEPK